MTHEGTKHAREQYEKQHGTMIEDTTSDDVPLWMEPYRNRRSSSIQGARVLPAFSFARIRAAADHMRSLDWDTSDGKVEDESDGDESAEISEYLTVAELAQRQQRLAVASHNEDGEDKGSENQDGEAQVEEREEEEEEDDIEMPSSPIRGLAY